MPDGLGREWISRVGRRWSAFDGAARTYYPGADFTNGIPFRHPLFLVDDIVLFEYSGDLTTKPVRGETGFALFIREKCFAAICSRTFRQEEVLFYRQAKLRNLSSIASAKTIGNSSACRLRTYRSNWTPPVPRP